ncbi:MAG: uracil-DNA glycosylase [Dehalococcoidia bacterium]|nr:uracil-DNA glycosylase [Dehalococcoidia bacterium]
METTRQITLKDAKERAARLARIDEPHVAGLNAWVRELRRRLPEGDSVPWFDPADGGSNAQILWLLEAPSRRATAAHGGSGFISCDNNDQTAKNTFETRVEAGVDRSLVVHWNVIPYYIGTASKIRTWERSDILAVQSLLEELAELLPNVKAVIPAGDAARAAWYGATPPRWSRLHVAHNVPHPSPQNLNTRPGSRERIVEAWSAALAACS